MIQQNLMGEKAFRTSVIRSISYEQDEILKWILRLHCNDTETFELDPCFGNGNFYNNIPAPRFRSDIEPKFSIVTKADSTELPIDDNTICNMIFDPPFMFGVHGKALENISAQRFTMFKDFNELKHMYRASLKEFYRILIPKGILVFKCQDYTDSKTTFTHCLVYNWATELGFYAKDLFILLNNSRIDNPKLNQRHSRKCHSYFWIFEKK